MFETHVGQRPLCLLGNYVKNDKRKCTKKLVMQQVSPLNPYKGIQMQSSLFTFSKSTNQGGSFSLDFHKTNNLKMIIFWKILFKLFKGFLMFVCDPKISSFTFTPPKFNMEPENNGFQMDFPFPGTYFQVPC